MAAVGAERFPAAASALVETDSTVLEDFTEVAAASMAVVDSTEAADIANAI
jgi:hypothetical protein